MISSHPSTWGGFWGRGAGVAVCATQELALGILPPSARDAGADGRLEGVSAPPASSEELVGDLGRAEDGGLRDGR